MYESKICVNLKFVYEYIQPAKDSISYAPLIMKAEIDSLSQPSLITTPVIVLKIRGVLFHESVWSRDSTMSL